MASQSAACTVVDILGEMMSAGFMFVSYDQTHNRSHLPGFETIMKAVCRDSAVCVQPLILALIGSLNCIVVIVQVFGFKKKKTKQISSPALPDSSAPLDSILFHRWRR